MPEFVLLLLMAAIARSVFFRWDRRAICHEPLSATLASISAAIAAAAPEAAATAAAAAPEAAAAAGSAAGAAGAGAIGGITAADIAATAGAAAGTAGAADIGSLAGSAGAAAGAAGGPLSSLISSSGAPTQIASLPTITDATVTGGAVPGASSAIPAAGGVGPGLSPSTLTASTGASTGPIDFSSGSADFSAAGGGADFGAGPSSGGILNKAGSFGGKALDYAAEHPLVPLGVGGIGLSLLMNNGTPPGLDKLQGEASLLSGRGNHDINALNTGDLPGGAQTALDQATTAAKATVKSNYANLGLTGSTQESEALAGIDQSAAVQKYEMLSKLTQTGLQEVGAADSLYTTIMNTELAQDKATQDAIGRISAALAGAGLSKAA